MFSTKKLRFLASARAAFMILVAASTVSAVRADVCLHKVFGDHMVLQRDQPVRVWGWAEPGEKVTVRFGGQSLSDAADQHGDWSVMLAPMSANATPQELAITGNHAAKVADVVVGDVWLCSGQSNMAFGLGADIGKRLEEAVDRYKQSLPAAVEEMEQCLAPAKRALAKDYGQKDLVYSGPLYRNMNVEGSKIRIAFDSVGTGLMIGTKEGRNPTVEDKRGKLTHFAIAGEDKQWVWADAVIDGNTVVVSNPEVPKPVAVRYAFQINPEGCNLYNKEGLPASPFCTDEWLME